MKQIIDPASQYGSVAIIVVTYNSSDLLPDFFASLRDALEGVKNYTIVLVDNASEDGTADTARRLWPSGMSVVVRESNGGYAAGINAGIHAAGAHHSYLVLNPDIRFHSGSIPLLLEALDEPGVGISVPRLVDSSGSLQHTLHRTPSILRAWGDALLGGKRAGRIPILGETISVDSEYSLETVAAWASGAAMAISSECLEAAGLWNESFFLYSEETEFCLRARDAGFVVRLEPNARATHIGGDMYTSSRLLAMHVWNRVRLYRARHGVFASMLYRAGVVLNEAVRAIPVRGAEHRAGLAAVLFESARPKEVSGELASISIRLPEEDYVCFSAQDFWYHNRAHSDIQLMRNVAAQRKVLFVNSIAMRMPFPGRSTKAFRRIWRKAKSMAKTIRRPIPELPNFVVMTPVTIPLYGNRIARQLSAALVRAQVRLAMAFLRIKNPNFVVTIPTAWDVVQFMPRSCLVYNRSDLHSGFPEADRSLIERYEASLFKEADFVCYASRALLEAERSVAGDRAVFIDHGVDLKHFSVVSAEERPPEMKDVHRPCIGFFGGLDDYIIDFDLLERVAMEMPEASLVLVGDATCSMRRFEKYDNVYWYGFQPYERIPAFGSCFDVALMPWLDNEWIRHSNPIKLKEYLALGLPVVTIDFPEAHYYKRFLTICEKSSFIDAIRGLVSSGPPSGSLQRSAVLTNTWANQAQRLISLCEARERPTQKGS